MIYFSSCFHGNYQNIQLHSQKSCHDGYKSKNHCCQLIFFNIVCVRSELLYNLTADVGKKQKSQSSRVYFTQSGSQINRLSHQLSLDINREQCQRYTAYVKVSLPWPVWSYSCYCAASVLR